jgi:AcrR family transcriptional regulator
MNTAEGQPPPSRLRWSPYSDVTVTASESAGERTEPRAPRRRYDSPVRRQQVAEMRERIAAAGAALARELPTWDLRAITFRAVADRAGVGERTVYRHFATERALHDGVMQRLEQEAGVSYEGIGVDDVSAIGAKVFAAFSTFRGAASGEVSDPTMAAEDARRRHALLAAVDDATEGWSEEERARAAAVLDVLWSMPSYLRLVSAWQLDAQAATGTIDWVIRLVVDGIRDGRRPVVDERPRGARRKRS